MLSDSLIGTVIIGCAALYLFYKAATKKEWHYLYIALLLLCTRVSGWPFYTSMKVGFALMAFASALFHLYVFTYKKKEPRAWLFAVVFFVLSGALFVPHFFPQK